MRIMNNINIPEVCICHCRADLLEAPLGALIISDAAYDRMFDDECCGVMTDLRHSRHTYLEAANGDVIHRFKLLYYAEGPKPLENRGGGPRWEPCIVNYVQRDGVKRVEHCSLWIRIS